MNISIFEVKVKWVMNLIFHPKQSSKQRLSSTDFSRQAAISEYMRIKFGLSGNHGSARQ